MFMRHPYGGYFGDFGGHGVGLFGLVLMVAFWAVVALLIVMLVQAYRRGPRHLNNYAAPHGVGSPTGVTTNPAIDILKERFARGEVSEEEFTRRLALLKDS
jgi:uncharacterized membrane protein